MAKSSTNTTLIVLAVVAIGGLAAWRLIPKKKKSGAGGSGAVGGSGGAGDYYPNPAQQQNIPGFPNLNFGSGQGGQGSGGAPRADNSLATNAAYGNEVDLLNSYKEGLDANGNDVYDYSLSDLNGQSLNSYDTTAPNLDYSAVSIPEDNSLVTALSNWWDTFTGFPVDNSTLPDQSIGTGDAASYIDDTDSNDVSSYGGDSDTSGGYFIDNPGDSNDGSDAGDYSSYSGGDDSGGGGGGDGSDIGDGGGVEDAGDGGGDDSGDDS